MKRIYFLSTCSTCQRIMKETGTDGFELIDIKETNIDGAMLDALKEQHGSYEVLFNKRALKFRSQGWNEKTLTDQDYRNLILDEYTFLKRPVYIIDNKSFAGNSKATVEAIKQALSE